MPKHERQLDQQFSSLIERVLLNDFYEFSEEVGDFNRLKTLSSSGIWLEKHEIL